MSKGIVIQGLEPPDSIYYCFYVCFFPIVNSRPASFFFITNSCYAFVRAILKQPFCSLLSSTCQ
jgi:hypothetical protein